MKVDLNVDIHHLTRIEGHARVEIDIDDAGNPSSISNIASGVTPDETAPADTREMQGPGLQDGLHQSLALRGVDAPENAVQIAEYLVGKGLV